MTRSTNHPDADYRPEDMGPPEGNNYEPIDPEAEMERLADCENDLIPL